MASLEDYINPDRASACAMPAVFDLSRLIHSTFGDEQLMGEVVALFFAQLSDSRNRLEAACDNAAWQYAAHTLKGAAAAMGALQLASIARGWEENGLPDGPFARQAAIATFDEVAAACRLAMKKACA